MKLLNASFLVQFRNKHIRKFNYFINGCDISHKTIIGKNFKLSHNGNGIIIGGGVIIGDNVRINPNTIIGYNNGYPKIENNVTIYGNSIIIGNIIIGENSIIGIGSFVNKNIPKNSIVYNKKELIIKELLG